MNLFSEYILYSRHWRNNNQKNKEVTVPDNWYSRAGKHCIKEWLKTLFNARSEQKEVGVQKVG